MIYDNFATYFRRVYLFITHNVQHTKTYNWRTQKRKQLRLRDSHDRMWHIEISKPTAGESAQNMTTWDLYEQRNKNV